MVMESNLGQRGETMDTVVKVSFEKDGVLQSSEIVTFKKDLRVRVRARVSAEEGGDLFPSGEDDAMLKIANGKGSMSLDGERMELSPYLQNGELADDCQIPTTPTKNTFDPFAPAPEEFAAFAPKKKVVKESRVPIRRHLTFECSDSDSIGSVEAEVSEDHLDNDDSLLLELICKSFLELVLSNQLEDVHMKTTPAKKASIGEEFSSPSKKASIGEEFSSPAKKANIGEGFNSPANIGEEFNSPAKKANIGDLPAKKANIGEGFNSPTKKATIGEGFNSPAKKANIGEEFTTPTLLPFLNGIAETCPPAPRRQTSKARKLADCICKKLDFGGIFEDVMF